jgi:hypothetical protein
MSFGGPGWLVGVAAGSRPSLAGVWLAAVRLGITSTATTRAALSIQAMVDRVLLGIMVVSF